MCHPRVDTNDAMVFQFCSHSVSYSVLCEVCIISVHVLNLRFCEEEGVLLVFLTLTTNENKTAANLSGTTDLQTYDCR